MTGDDWKVAARNATRLDLGYFADEAEMPSLAVSDATSLADLGFDPHLQAANTPDPSGLDLTEGVVPYGSVAPAAPFMPELRKDLAAGMRNWRLCVLLGTTELRRRYSRSRLGQTWITVTTGLSAALLAGFWSALWHQPFATLFLHVMIGQILWLFVSGIVIEATTLFPAHVRYLHNQHTPLSVIVASSVWRNLLIFAHNLVAVLVALAIARLWPAPAFLMILPALAIIIVTATATSVIIAALCVRWRDAIQLVTTLMPVLFYLTPIIWKVEFLPPTYRFWTAFNPILPFIEILRAPLTMEWPTLADWRASLIVCVVASAIAGLVIERFGRRVSLWA
jgi:ABC-type polysaccharide/polyol phosphate export permease